jgi:hypothetical protein
MHPINNKPGEVIPPSMICGGTGVWVPKNEEFEFKLTPNKIWPLGNASIGFFTGKQPDLTGRY